ncbi:MAG: phage tail protein I [Blautia sp.]|nr:phage tail protein I [Blautia sp.]
MSMKLENVDIIKLLPPWMRQDEANKALGSAINTLIREPAARIRQLRIWDMIDELDDVMLDELAWEFGIDWWKSEFSSETKRDVIKTFHQVYEKRGTKWAVEELITSTFGMGKVTEWFEYDGEPYHFKISTDAVLTPEQRKAFNAMIEKVKNTRSHLETIEINRDINQEITAGIGMRMTYMPAAMHIEEG